MRRTIQSLLVVSLVLALSQVATAQLNRFVGRWRNMDANTRGITAVQITVDGKTVRVHAWGKASPTDSDLGEVTGCAYGPSVDAKLPDSTRAISAAYKSDFSETLLIIRPVQAVQGARMWVDSYTRYTDQSGRTDYVQSYRFVKDGGAKNGTEDGDKQETADAKGGNAVVGQPFPELHFKTFDGKPFDIAKLKGKVVLIDFWATWCGPCRREMPNVISLYEKYHEKGFEIVGISLDKDREKLEEYLKANNVRWPQHFDGKGWQNDVATRFGVNSIPCTFLLDRQGIVRFKKIRSDALEKAIASLL